MSRRRPITAPAQVPSVVSKTAPPSGNDVLLQAVDQFLYEKRTGRYMNLSINTDATGANTIELEISDPK